MTVCATPGGPWRHLIAPAPGHAQRTGLVPTSGAPSALLTNALVHAHTRGGRSRGASRRQMARIAA
jgi:hypothetical protein